MRWLDYSVCEEIGGDKESEGKRKKNLGNLVDVLGQSLSAIVGGQHRMVWPPKPPKQR